MSRRRFDLDATVAFSDLHLLVPMQAQTVPDRLRYHQPPRPINGSPHGMKSTIHDFRDIINVDDGLKLYSLYGPAEHLGHPA